MYSRSLNLRLLKPSTAFFEGRVGWAGLFLITAAIVLAIEPAIWLASTWLDPAYDSSGYLVFAVAAGLFGWSAASPVVVAGRSNRKPAAFLMLALSGGVRLASQILAINTIGAICLVVDVFAVGLLFRLDHRMRAVSPGWLAVVFAFSLPLERVLQRSIGYLLQEFSAQGACGVMSVVYSDTVCQGTRLIVNRVDVLVDLPCSGARTLLLGLLGFAVAASLVRPRPHQVLAGLALTLAAAAATNILRISLLAVGLAEPERLGGISVMEQPWHDIIGLSTLSLVYMIVILWAGQIWRPSGARRAGCQERAGKGSRIPIDRSTAPRSHIALSIAVLGIASVIVSLPRTALDVARAAEPAILPLTIDGHQRNVVPLSAREQQFFTQFGGSAAKAEYGPHGLLVTRTTSPLRHLHAPDDCLRGLGFDVEYLGAVFEPVPTAAYRAIAPDGRRYRIDVSFVSDQGAVTTNVSTAVWLWLQGRAHEWTAVQRISPEAMPLPERARFTGGVLAALDLARAIPVATSKGLEIQ
ncbi:MAG TPA: exosortase T [Thermohalobaculum sp.]|nr:exosortase T [Thermohalobaculum sp.]